MNDCPVCGSARWVYRPGGYANIRDQRICKCADCGCRWDKLKRVPRVCATCAAAKPCAEVLYHLTGSLWSDYVELDTHVSCDKWRIK